MERFIKLKRLKSTSVGLIDFATLDLQDFADRLDWDSENLRGFNYIAQDTDGTIRGYGYQPYLNSELKHYHERSDDRCACTLQCASPIGVPFVTTLLKRPSKPEGALLESLKRQLDDAETNGEALRSFKDARD